MFLIILWSSLTCQNKKDTLVDPVESSFKDLTFSRTNESGHYGSNKYFQKNRICGTYFEPTECKNPAVCLQSSSVVRGQRIHYQSESMFYFNYFRGCQKGAGLCFHKKLSNMKKWRPRGRLSIFSSRIFRSFPIILDPLENNIKIKMLQDNLLGK